MDITNMSVECDEKGQSKVSLYLKARSVEDLDDIIAWLQLAKQVTAKWEKIRAKREPKP